MLKVQFENLINDVIKITEDAGKIALNYFYKGYKKMKKGRNDVVTEADFAVNNYLEKELMNLLPNAGWLSEESVDNVERLTKDFIWIVDPIDGTYQFTKETNEWVISIALIDNSTKQPVLGVIYNPCLKEMYSAELNKGLYLNGQLVAINNLKESTRILTTTRSKRNLLKVIKNGLRKNHKINQVGSIAYILALISIEKSHAFITYKTVNEWDIAAGFILIHESGGNLSLLPKKNELTLKENNKITFNNRDVVHKGIYGVSGQYKEKYGRFLN